MCRRFAVVLFVALAVSISAGQAQNSTVQSGQSSAKSAPAASKKRGTFTVELVKGLESKKLKEGDNVEAKLTGSITLPDGSVLPRGTAITGHVTEAKARSKQDSESELGISFDKIGSPGGSQTLITGVVAAAAPSPAPLTGGPDAGANIYNNLNSSTTAAIAQSQTSTSVPILNDKSRGVLGIPDLTLKPDGVFTSSGKQVKLNAGIRLLLNVTLQ
jgi:hypothetical protein